MVIARAGMEVGALSALTGASGRGVDTSNLESEAGSRTKRVMGQRNRRTRLRGLHRRVVYTIVVAIWDSAHTPMKGLRWVSMGVLRLNSEKSDAVIELQNSLLQMDFANRQVARAEDNALDDSIACAIATANAIEVLQECSRLLGHRKMSEECAMKEDAVQLNR